MRSEFGSLPGLGPRPTGINAVRRVLARLWYRGTVAYLHSIQPLARVRGRIRGVLPPPDVALPPPQPQTSRGPRPSLGEAWRALLLISGSITEDRFWTETWTSADRVLSQLTDWLRRSRAVRTIKIDEGWSDDRDVSMFVGRWAWLDVRALVEDHGAGKALLRVSTHLRPTTFGVVSALGLGAALLVAAAAGVAARRPLAGAYGPAIQAWFDTPGGIVVAPTGDVYFADSNNDVIRRIDAANRIITPVAGNHDLGTGFSGDDGDATNAQLDTPDGVAIAPDGDLIVADSHNDRIRRVDRPTGVITTVAGSGENGYDRDEKLATEAALNTPSAVACAPNGDIYIADTLNNRIRMIDHATGFIHTVAGDGTTGDTGPIGDGGPATSARLFMPADVALAP